MNGHNRSFSIYLRPRPEVSAITPSSVLLRVPPHQPPPPRPFWLRLFPRGRVTNEDAPGIITTEPEEEFPSASPAVIFEATIIREDPEEEEELEVEQLPPVREPKKRRIGLFRFSSSRKSVSMPSLSRREHSRSVLSDVMSTDQYHHREEVEEEKQPESDDDDNEPERDRPSFSTLTSSSVIGIVTASALEARARSAPPPQHSRARTNRPYADENAEQSYWIRADIEPGIAALRSAYAGRITQQTPAAIFVKEVQAEALLSLPHYIGKLGGWYTEIECREVFGNMCKLVRILHKNRTVHRNLHLNQFLVNPNTVR